DRAGADQGEGEDAQKLADQIAALRPNIHAIVSVCLRVDAQSPGAVLARGAPAPPRSVHLLQRRGSPRSGQGQPTLAPPHTAPTIEGARHTTVSRAGGYRSGRASAATAASAVARASCWLAEEAASSTIAGSSNPAS